MDTVITAERIELPPGAVLKLLGDWKVTLTLNYELL